jgi:hypothetical protein
MHVAWNGRKELVLALVEIGAALDLQSSDGFTAPMHASLTGHAEVVLILAQSGASLDLQSIVGVACVCVLLCCRTFAVGCDGRIGSCGLRESGSVVESGCKWKGRVRVSAYP